jgi:hypothetical protein
MKAKLMLLGVSVVVVAFILAFLVQREPATALTAVLPTPIWQPPPPELPPVADTNGVPMPTETPYDDRPIAKAHYLQNYCLGYRLAARSTNWGFTTQCYFGPMPPPENVLAADAGWNAGQAACNATKQLQPRLVQRRTNAEGGEILTFQLP